ncbi:UDP-glucuronic acid decarboxylase Uxs1p [Papiliotrema laurentii]|uniref:UDP-glucuronate decarboxylase n=1 Tax=Papiliotrema laurentii TaxID=5418 RepID=A0AAD9FVW7_PAPLA|nr:UDP-glucuronic acid decarboxylase Uxs1p [Papiliotrema laurentii]
MATSKEQEITSVGHNRFGFDSRVEVDTLRSLYLAPTNKSSKDFGTESTYDQASNSIQYTTVGKFPPVKLLPNAERKRILITGGAGFVGSHLVDRLMLLGHEVTVLDNFFTGSRTTVSHWVGHPNFEMVRHDVVEPFLIEVDQIYHLACPASPPHYQYNAVKTIKTSFMGTLNMLGLAKRTKARFLITSTSEVYGDPEEHPQREDYWGHVNCIGPRACYDEGKRVAETLTYGYMRQDGVDVRVARIFNTFGPRMNPYDGRVVSNFIIQALKGEDMTVYGDGKQTRSFQYVHDLVDGLILLMNGDDTRPVNIGSSHEFTILDFAEAVRDIVEEVQKEEGNPLAKRVNIIHKDMPIDDPQRRRADTSRAKESLQWQPQWNVRQGVREMVLYYSQKLKDGSI